MKDPQETAQILWGIDVLGDDMDAQLEMASFLKLWVHGLPLNIQPIYAMWAESGLTAANHAAIIDQYSKTYYSRFAREAKLHKFSPIKILIANGVSLHARVDKILDYAYKTRATAIALTTHARSGLPRWALGSFTESMILRSRIPLLTLNPQTRPVHELKHLLFPMDFSKEAAHAFQMVIEEAKLRKLKLTLLHNAQFDFEHPEAGYGSAAGYSQSKVDYLKKRHAQMRGAVKLAKTTGLDVDEIILEQENDLFKAILDVANERKVDIIAMTSHSGSLEATFGGSLTRIIIRGADCPIWAIHPAQQPAAP